VCTRGNIISRQRCREEAEQHLPGRPKTDKLDAVWLCKVAERQMLRPSFVPPPEIRQLRDLTRYRADLVAVRTAEKNRVEKLLEDAQIKLSTVVSDVFGVSGREMRAALIAGESDPKALAQLARTRMRVKSRCWRRRSSGASPTITGFCCAPCSPASTKPAPTSPRSRARSRS
jgi:transposase